LLRNPCHPLFARDVFGAGFADVAGDRCSAPDSGARSGAASGGADARVSSMATVIDAPAPAGTGVMSSCATGGALWPATDGDDEVRGSVER
jgi:hypothetical protein